MAGRGRPRSFDRAAALDTAMRLFWEKGYDNTSLSDLTDAMGVAPPSLYGAFGSKEELFGEALDLYGMTEAPPIWNHVLEAETIRAAMQRFLTESARAFSRRGKPRGCLIILGALHANGANKAVCDQLRTIRNQNRKLLEKRFARAVDDGELPRSFDCRSAATFFMAVQQGMSIQARDGASREMLLSIADHAMTVLDQLSGTSV